MILVLVVLVFWLLVGIGLAVAYHRGLFGFGVSWDESVRRDRDSAIKQRDHMLGIRRGRGWIEVFRRVGGVPAPRCDLADYLVAR